MLDIKSRLMSYDKYKNIWKDIAKYGLIKPNMSNYKILKILAIVLFWIIPLNLLNSYYHNLYITG